MIMITIILYKPVENWSTVKGSPTTTITPLRRVVGPGRSNTGLPVLYTPRIIDNKSQGPKVYTHIRVYIYMSMKSRIPPGSRGHVYYINIVRPSTLPGTICSSSSSFYIRSLPALLPTGSLPFRKLCVQTEPCSRTIRIVHFFTIKI